MILSLIPLNLPTAEKALALYREVRRIGNKVLVDSGAFCIKRTANIAVFFLLRFGLVIHTSFRMIVSQAPIK